MLYEPINASKILLTLQNRIKSEIDFGKRPAEETLG